MEKLPKDESFDFSSFGKFGPTIALEEGLDLKELAKPGSSGVELEFSTEGVEDGVEQLNLQGNKAYFEGMQSVTRMFDDPSDDEENSDLSWFNRLKVKMHDITEDGGVKKFIKKEGVGIVVPSGARIRAHYDGYLEDLDEPYDSSRLRHRELQITLGKGEVLPGLEIGLASMRGKEIARFMVSPSYAFGKRGCPPRIPENAYIMFEVELLGFTEASALDDYKEMSNEEKREMTFEKVLEVAKASLAVGNDMFARELFGKAIKKYMNTINILETATLQDGDEEAKVLHYCMKAYLNMGQCHLKLGNFGKAVAAARKVLGWQKEHLKGLYLCGKALRHLGNFSESRRYLLRAHKLSPQSKEVAVELKYLDSTEAKCNAVEKEMYKKMFK